VTEDDTEILIACLALEALGVRPIRAVDDPAQLLTQHAVNVALWVGGT
jgi:hypothetical protein